MTQATPFLPPVARSEGIERLQLRIVTPPVLVPVDLASGADEWEKLVAQELAALEQVVCEERAGVRCKAGSNRTKNFPLFTYRTFDPPSNNYVDAIVVGITFQKTTSGLLIRGSILGEQSGKIYLAKEIEATSAEQAQRAATQIAKELKESIKLLLDAIDSPEPLDP